MTDVVFLNGGISWTPLIRSIGPYKIAHWIRKHGYACQVIDFVDRMDEEVLLNSIVKFVDNNTKILAISTTFISNNEYIWENGGMHRAPESLINVLKNVKNRFSNIKIVCGGYMSDRVSGWGIVDATIMSYTQASEDIFLEYLDHLTKGTPLPYGDISTPTFGNSKYHKRPIYNIARNPIYTIELDDFKFVKEDCILPDEPLPLDISRGCIFACRFCQYPNIGKKKLDYVRGMSYIEQEILYNYENFGTTKYYLLDDTFNDTETKVKAFYDISQRLPFKITLSGYIRADLLERFPDTPFMLAEAGLNGAYHGIETFHPKASSIIGKAWSGKGAKEYLPKLYHDIWKNKVAMHTNFIVGITGDTKQNIYDTIDWFHSNDMHSILFLALGLFGPNSKTSRFTMLSEFDKNAEKYGFTFLEEQKEGYISWKNDNWDTNLAKVFTDEANNMIKESTKINSWATQVMTWYGYEMEDILTLPYNKINWSPIHFISKTKLTQYINTLNKL